ncbi:uncharacterized protein C11orf52 homolog isoform X3 [Phyllostomus discolor]|uniref:Uncharacterized protein C11orf52 homolog isoform X3 n=1 Tax=Phyllostomus discolor TaxID=89673 RepID=A0A7E6E016_9CHIR|nr:uncharacterized protein C11orf52 homolog isoform X3 [Phyllostomus discolor]
MGNRLCCGKSCPEAEAQSSCLRSHGWSCPSIFQRKKKMGSQPRWTLKQQQQQKQNGTKVITGLCPFPRAAQMWDARTWPFHSGTDTSQSSIELACLAHPPLPS